MATLSTSAVSDLKAQIDAFTAAPDNAPGIVYSAVNKKGELIFNHASGKAGHGRSEEMTEESVLWIASCTKMITGIACMQLVEQGKLELDSVEQVEKIAPELKDIKVLQDGRLVEKQRGITLRMLLTHTAGFGYSFFNQRLNEYSLPAGLNELSGDPYSYLTQPLVNQPGSRWEYGINIDWAGVLLMRVTGLSLNDYFQEHIFKPMGISQITMFPTAEMKKNLVWQNFRDAEGKISLYPEGHLNSRPLMIDDTPEARKTVFNQGGAGCFAVPSQYCQVIATLLNDGTHPGTGTQILKKETVDTMFTNQIPEMPDYGFQGVIPAKPTLSNPLPALFPEPADTPQGWGLTFFLHLQQGGYHSKGTAWWAGLPNLFWWCDREKGIGGIIGSQILPFGDPKVMGLWVQIEGGIYSNLQSSDTTTADVTNLTNSMKSTDITDSTGVKNDAATAADFKSTSDVKL